MALSMSRRSFFVAETRFYAIMAIVMALVNVGAFSLFAAMGISSFRAPLWVHVHAILFMGWVFLFLVQTSLGATGSLALHRRLGWIAVGWAMAMVVVGSLTTVWTAQKATVPFFFLPAQFLLMNPLSVLLFAALLIGGVIRRRDRDWHPRLVLCAMAAIMGPAFGRLLPAPLFMYTMVTAVFVAMIAFPIVGIVRDKRRHGRVHPAWWVGFGALIFLHLVTETLGRSRIALALYDRVVAGTPGAQVPGLAYQHPPFPVLPR